MYSGRVCCEQPLMLFSLHCVILVFICFSLLPVPLTIMGDASMEPTISPPDSTAQQDSLFSMMDVFLISLITGLLTYWFFFRKKKEEVPDLPKMQSV